MSTRSRATLRTGIATLPVLVILVLFGTIGHDPAGAFVFWIGGYALFAGAWMLWVWIFYGDPERVAAAKDRRELSGRR